MDLQTLIEQRKRTSPDVHVQTLGVSLRGKKETKENDAEKVQSERLVCDTPESCADSVSAIASVHRRCFPAIERALGAGRIACCTRPPKNNGLMSTGAPPPLSITTEIQPHGENVGSQKRGAAMSSDCGGDIISHTLRGSNDSAANKGES